MKFLADECVDAPIVARLREYGHTIVYVAEMAQGVSDDEVLDLANDGLMLLMTGDKDFGELVFRLQRVAEGVVLIRITGLSNERKADIVAKAVAEHGQELPGCFTVVEASSVRIRRRFGAESQGKW
jgi:predicted nuclease of predicted toxin-antitoxin system